jgi:hypothetical protein
MPEPEAFTAGIEMFTIGNWDADSPTRRRAIVRTRVPLRIDYGRSSTIFIVRQHHLGGDR